MMNQSKILTHLFLRNIYLFLLCLAVGLQFSSESLAENSASDADSIFLVLSPRNKCYAVQQVLEMNRLREDSSLSGIARFQMFDTASGKLLWDANRAIAKRGELFISDDATMMMIVKFHILLSHAQGVTYKDLPKEDQERIAKNTVITFLKRDKVVKEYSLAELGFDMGNLSSGANLSYGCDTFNDMRWIAAEAKNRETIGKNPVFRGHQVVLAMADGKYRYFDFKTGKFLKTEDIPLTESSGKTDNKSDPFAPSPPSPNPPQTDPDRVTPNN